MTKQYPRKVMNHFKIRPVDWRALTHSEKCSFVSRYGWRKKK